MKPSRSRFLQLERFLFWELCILNPKLETAQQAQDEESQRLTAEFEYQIESLEKVTRLIFLNPRPI